MWQPLLRIMLPTYTYTLSYDKKTKPPFDRKSSPCFRWSVAPLHREKLVCWPGLGWSCWYSWSGTGASCLGGQLLWIWWRTAQASDRTANQLLSNMMRVTEKILADHQSLPDLRILTVIQTNDLLYKNRVEAHLLGAQMVQQLAGESSSGCRRPTGCCDHDGPGFPPGFCVSVWPVKPWFQRQSCQGLLLGADNQKIQRFHLFFTGPKNNIYYLI